VTGIDLIKEQIRIASGAVLELKQRNVPCNGCAIEARINAEDPENGFRGCPGTISKLRLPGGFGVRFDSHVYEGYKISPYYDSMIGKLIVHKPTREEAIACLQRSLNELIIEGAGIKTTIPLTRKILDHTTFMTGAGDTSFVERTF
jgi:acetyl-CoA carboxylase biotin carboxylase subunit